MQLAKWVHEPMWISKVKVIHWPWSKVTQIQHFQTSFPEKPLGRLKSNFMWSLIGMGEWKFVQMAHMTKMAAMPIYSAGEEKSPYFLFHGETALCKILKFQGETANFSEKFQGEIAEFLRENMELYRQNLKISERNTGISWRKYWISWRNLEKFSTISPSFSQKERQLIMEKNKKWGFLFTCTVC